MPVIVVELELPKEEVGVGVTLDDSDEVLMVVTAADELLGVIDGDAELVLAI